MLKLDFIRKCTNGPRKQSVGVTGQEGDVKVLIQHTPLPGEPHICSKDIVTASGTSGFRLDLEKLGVSKEIRAGLEGAGVMGE